MTKEYIDKESRRVLATLGKYVPCDWCELTFYWTPTVPKWPWKLWDEGRVKYFCSYKCMRAYMRKKGLR